MRPGMGATSGSSILVDSCPIPTRPWIAPSVPRWITPSTKPTWCCCSSMARTASIPWMRKSHDACGGPGDRSCSPSTSSMICGCTRPGFHFYALGLGEPWPVSAATGQGSGDLLDALVAALPVADAAEDDERIRVAIVGRPNVGKSSLANKLLGEDRHVVTPIAGTTRDAIDSTAGVSRTHAHVHRHGRAPAQGARRRRHRVLFQSAHRARPGPRRRVPAGGRCEHRVAEPGPAHRDARMGRGLRPDHRGEQVGPRRREGCQHGRTWPPAADRKGAVPRERAVHLCLRRDRAACAQAARSDHSRWPMRATSACRRRR